MTYILCSISLLFPSVNALLLLFSPHIDPRESITTSTQPYKDIQTSTDSLTTTPAAHSESPSVTASQTIRDTSPDDTTHSLSTTGNKATSFLLYYLINVIFTIKEHPKTTYLQVYFKHNCPILSKYLALDA